MHSREPSEARAEEPAVRAVADLTAMPAANGGAGPYVERILALQRAAGNNAVHRMITRRALTGRPVRRLARDGPAPAGGEAAAAVAAAAADWVAVVSR